MGKMQVHSSRKKDIVADVAVVVVIRRVSMPTFMVWEVSTHARIAIMANTSQLTFLAWDMFTQVRLPTMEVSTFLASEVSTFADQYLSSLSGQFLSKFL